MQALGGRKSIVRAWPVSLVLAISNWQFAGATTRFVPPYATIQSAINASATTGDTVRVFSGTYVENLTMTNKDVVVMSQSGPQSTIIDGRNPADPSHGSVMVFRGVGDKGKLSGFTLTHGSGTSQAAGGPWLAGGGIAVIDSHDRGPMIENNLIVDNDAGRGAGILIASTARVLHNRVEGNVAIDHGGGVLVTDPAPASNERKVIQENEIVSNSASDGGGIKVLGSNGNGCDVVRNIVACNQASQGAGLSGGSHPLVNAYEGNTFFANWIQGDSGGIIYLYTSAGESSTFHANIVSFNIGRTIECYRGPGSPSPLFECNDIYGNSSNTVDGDCGSVFGQNNNIVEDPMFGQVTSCPLATGGLCLASGSPLLPENSPPGCGLIGARGLCNLIGLADETPAPEVERNRVGAQPNPFATRTTLVIDLIAPGEIDIRITTALGRVVAEESLGTLHAGRHRWTWDGRDAHGRQAPTGAYYAEVKAGGRSLVTRLMVLR